MLFTCVVIRAVHLELVKSLSTEQTLLALRHLAACRGLSFMIFSDNAKCFIASPQQLQRQFGHVSHDWRFIAPRSSWWRGWWERLIPSIKSPLKTFERHFGTRTELEITLHEVESCVKSRPLTFVPGEAAAESPLTPAHFPPGSCWWLLWEVNLYPRSIWWWTSPALCNETATPGKMFGKFGPMTISGIYLHGVVPGENVTPEGFSSCLCSSLLWNGRWVWQLNYSQAVMEWSELLRSKYCLVSWWAAYIVFTT